MKSVRLIAAESLVMVEEQKGWSNLVLDNQIKKYKLESRDAGFLSALFYGVLERKITLDACISPYSKMPIDKLSPAVLASLRLGVYQLLYMQGVPSHSAVSESVQIVKFMRKTQASGFVNGVLRSFIRSDMAIPKPAGGIENQLSVEYSCPAQLVKFWIESYGLEQTKVILAGSLGRPPLYLRVNSRKMKPQELLERLHLRNIECHVDEHLPDCLVVENPAGIHSIPEYKKGFFHTQDKASQLCAQALQAQPDMRVLDACAAPGGKSFTLAQIMNDSGQVVAMELYPQRVGLIDSGAARLMLKSVQGVLGDATVFSPELGEFDRVLCDVPCSGLGVIRRKPEIKYKPLEEFSELPKLQYKILENTSQYCKVGGRIIYSTCTLNPKENEQVVQLFLQNHPNFAPAPIGGLLEEETCRTILCEYGADGFFIAAIDRKM